MSKKVSANWSSSLLSLGVVVLLLMLFFFSLVHFPGYNYYTETASASASQTQVDKNIISSIKNNYSLPVRLKIPKIKLDTSLESVGLTAKGEVGVPKGPSNAAWFNLWPRPGDVGNSIITGHYGYWKDGRSGIFNNLSKLKPGDLIYTQDKKGVLTAFVVRKIIGYDQFASALEVFNSIDGKAHLNLITCEGAWNKVSKSYSQRLVVLLIKNKNISRPAPVLINWGWAPLLIEGELKGRG